MVKGAFFLFGIWLEYMAMKRGVVKRWFFTLIYKRGASLLIKPRCLKAALTKYYTFKRVAKFRLSFLA